MENIKIELLYPHPQNPRKDVGDVSELADSIKSNGVYQNLTVIKNGPGVPEGKTGFTVIIGHRRLAAAKQAGIKELPCFIVEMSQKQQVATMLLENMQRSDLTIYEQAQGFQMMLDLGETQSTISDKTGFSLSTIRHRIKLLELDPDEFKKSQEKNVTLADYIELEKITDPKLKNKALKEIGTNNFRWSVSNAVQQEERAKNRLEWVKLLDSVAEEVEIGERSNREQVAFFYVSSKITDSNRDKIDNAVKSNDKLYYAFDPYNYAYLFGKEKPKQDCENQKQNKEREERENRVARIKELANQANELREKFVSDYTGAKTHLTELLTNLLEMVDRCCYDLDFEKIANLLKININDEESDELPDEEELLFSNKEYLNLIAKQPQRVILAYLCAIYEETHSNPFCNWCGEYVENKKMKKWYDILSKCGYMISSEEQQLLDGTHSVFENNNQEEIKNEHN